MNYLILNLAVADIMVALFIVPRFIFVHIFNHPDGMTGTVLCKLLTGGNLIWIGSVATAFTLVVVAIERYHAVINSHSNQGQLTATKVEVSGQGDCRRLFRTANYSVSPEKKKMSESLNDSKGNFFINFYITKFGAKPSMTTCKRQLRRSVYIKESCSRNFMLRSSQLCLL